MVTVRRFCSGLLKRNGILEIECETQSKMRKTKKILRIIPQKFVNRMPDDLNILLYWLQFSGSGIFKL